MDLPKLSPGKRFALPRPPGSADALLLGRLAEREKAAQRPVGIVTANAAMADGVARATLPTLTGMAVAVVGLLFTSRLEQIIRREDQRLHDRLARAVEDTDA